MTDESFPTSTSEQNSNKLKELLEINLPKSEAFTEKLFCDRSTVNNTAVNWMFMYYRFLVIR